MARQDNLIEAISFLAPGRGLRRATLDEVAFQEGNGSWAVAADIDGALGLPHWAPDRGAAAEDTAVTRNAESTVSRRCRRPPCRTICG